MTQVQHIFAIAFENRSFDHLFGYSPMQGFDASTRQQTTLNNLLGSDHTNVNPQNGQTIHHTPDAPFSLPSDGDLPHEFGNILTALCGPGHPNTPLPSGQYPAVNVSGFVANYVSASHPDAAPNVPMQGFPPSALPVFNRLAAEFAICDNWFCGMPGPTWPNRFFLHAASATGQADSPPNSAIFSAYTGIDCYTFHYGTIYDRLADAGHQFRIYSADGCPQTKGIATNNHGQLTNRDLSLFATDLAGDYPFAYTFIEPDYGTRTPVIDVCHSTGENDMHPPSDVRSGDALLAHVYAAIRNSPLWQTSMLIVTFDEGGAFYDHVVPPKVPALNDGSVDNTHHFAYDQLGQRVPTIVVSPWIAPNTIDKTMYEHSSLPATIERNFGLAALTNRDSGAHDVNHLLTETLRLDAPLQIPTTEGQLLHTIGTVAGSWQPVGDAAGAARLPAPARSVAAAGTPDSHVQFLIATYDGRLMHTIRNPNGTWQPAADAANAAQLPGPSRAVAAAAAADGSVHYVISGIDGMLRHTIRDHNAVWQPAGNADLAAHIPSAVHALTAAVTPDGSLQVMAACDNGQLLHTIRDAAGSWQSAAVYSVAPVSVPVRAIAAAATPDGAVQYLIATTDGQLRHTIRSQDGSWQPAGDAVTAMQLTPIAPVPGGTTAMLPRRLAACANGGDVSFFVALAEQVTMPLIGPMLFSQLWQTTRHAAGDWVPASNLGTKLLLQHQLSSISATTSAGQVQLLMSTSDDATL